MNDENGHGGSYRINEKGERVLVERTSEDPPDSQLINQPASAGFFTSEVTTKVTPATPVDITMTNQE